MARKTAREVAMKLIYEERMGGEGRSQTIDGLMDVSLDADDHIYIQDIVEGVSTREAEMDALIEKHLVDWSMERVSRVDASILRLAVYEILYREDIPAAVSINEAVEMAHTYSTPEAAALINGVLGGIVRSPNT